MEAGLVEAFVKQTPVIGALLIIVVLFLRYLVHRDNSWVKAQEARDAAWATAVERQTRETIDLFNRYHGLAHEQMTVLRENSVALSHVANVIKECANGDGHPRRI